MRIHVHFQCAGALYKTRELHVNEGEAPVTVSQVLHQCAAVPDLPVREHHLPAVLTFVNGQLVRKHHTLDEDDTLLVVRLLAGG